MCERCSDLYSEVTSARAVARIAKQVMADERNRHINETRKIEKSAKKQTARIAQLEKTVETVKNDVMILSATVDSQEEQLQIKNGQISFLMCLVDRMADALDNGYDVTYAELVNSVRETTENAR